MINNTIKWRSNIKIYMLNNYWFLATMWLLDMHLNCANIKDGGIQIKRAFLGRLWGWRQKLLRNSCMSMMVRECFIYLVGWIFKKISLSPQWRKNWRGQRWERKENASLRFLKKNWKSFPANFNFLIPFHYWWLICFWVNNKDTRLFLSLEIQHCFKKTLGIILGFHFVLVKLYKASIQ